MGQLEILGHRSIKDAVLVHIPMEVTADLGIAMRRTRQKRIKKLRALYPSHFVETNPESKEPLDDNDNEDCKKNATNLKGQESNSQAMEDLKRHKSLEEKDITSKERKNVDIPRREQFASVLDYLEAKYVRGVMLDDIDEKMRRKKELKKQKRRNRKRKRKKQMMEEQNKQKGKSVKSKSNENSTQSLVSEDGSISSANCSAVSKKSGDSNISLTSETGSNIESDSGSEDGQGSCYSNDSGFLDDSLLRTSVAEQYMASSSYGTTRVEAESRKLKSNSRASQDSDTDMSFIDDGFFVNVGDLEMADGYDDTDAADIDFEVLLNSRTNNNKKKAKIKKKDKEKSNHINKDDDIKDNRTKNITPTKDKKKIKILPTTSDSISSGTMKNMMSKKRKLVSSSSPKSPAVSISKKKLKKKMDDKKPEIQTKKGKILNKKNIDNDNNINGKEETSIELPPEVQLIRDKCEELKKEMKRMYQKVVKEIKKMPPENLPRKKRRKKEMIKVSITIPQNKKAGDEIQFDNPRMPGQRLKVQVPESGVPGKSFVVSVPAPPDPKATNIANKNNTNIFTREAKEILDLYSKAYDNWIDMEAKYNAVAPDGDRKYKPNNQRLKKFDKLLLIFPTDLVEHIDASYLRKIVRRSRQNRSKRIKNSMSSPEQCHSSENATKSTSKQDDANDEDETNDELLDDSNAKVSGSDATESRSNPPTLPEGMEEFITLELPSTGTTFKSLFYNQRDFFR